MESLITAEEVKTSTSPQAPFFEGGVLGIFQRIHPTLEKLFKKTMPEAGIVIDGANKRTNNAIHLKEDIDIVLSTKLIDRPNQLEPHALASVFMDKFQEMTKISELQELIKNMPRVQTRLDWKGSQGEASLLIILEGGIEIKAALSFPKGGESFFKSLEEVIIPGELSSVVEKAFNLLNQDFRFEWNGRTNQFALNFASQQKIRVGSKSSLLNNASLELPQSISGKLTCAEDGKITIKFEPMITFKAHYGILGKEIDVHSMTVDPKESKLSFGISLLGDRTIDIQLPKTENDDIVIGYEFLGKHQEVIKTQKTPSKTPTPDVALEILSTDADKAQASNIFNNEKSLIPESGEEGNSIDLLKVAQGYVADNYPAYSNFVGALLSQDLDVSGAISLNLSNDKQSVVVNLTSPYGVNFQGELFLSNLDHTFLNRFQEEVLNKLKGQGDKKLSFNESLNVIMALLQDEVSLKYERGKLIVQAGSDEAPKLSFSLQAGVLQDGNLNKKLKTIIDQLPPALFNRLPQKLLPEIEEDVTPGEKIEKLLQNLRPLTAADWGVNLSAKERGLEAELTFIDGLTCNASLSFNEDAVLDESHSMIQLAKSAATGNLQTIFSQAERLKDLQVTFSWEKDRLVVTLQSQGVTLALTLDATEVLKNSTLLPTLQAFARKVGVDTGPLDQYTPLLKSFLNPGHSTAVWNGSALKVRFGLSDEVQCEAIFTPSKEALSDLQNHTIVAKVMKLLTKQGELNGQDLKMLLSLANDAQTKMNWKGATGEMDLLITLSDGSKLIFTLSAKELFGPNVQTLPPVIQSLVSKVPHGKALQTLFESLRPLLATNFDLIWNGKNGAFALEFKKEQKVHINYLKIPELPGVIGFIAKNADIFLPKTIQGKMDTSNVSIKVPEGLTLTAESGIISKDLVFDTLSYDVDTQMLLIQIHCWGSHTIKVPLGEQKKEEKKEEKQKPSEPVDISFFVGPQKV